MSAASTNSDVLQLLLSRVESIDRNVEFLRAELQSKVSTLEGEVHSIDHKLNGNGQPGFIADINDKIADLKEERGKLESRMWKIGVAATLVICFVCFFTGNGPVGLSNVLSLMGIIAK